MLELMEGEDAVAQEAYDQELKVTPKRRFGGGRVGHVRLQPVAQDAEDGGEAGLVAHHLAHGLVDTLARALHFLEQAAAAVERGALVAQLRQPPGEAGVAVAQGGSVGDVHMHLALEADGLVDAHHVLDHVVVACCTMAIELHAERLVPALDAPELLFQAALALVDGDAPEGMPATMRLNETIAFARTDGMPRRLSMMPVMVMETMRRRA